ncbi:MAG: hypothetical protein Q8P99_00035 [bacterium]|nr:hypothetical protein [bacterium]MDZ4231556.1 hypothetical protein [Patescibacteria group bacterium]
MKLLPKYPNLTLFGFSILVGVSLAYFGVFDELFGSLGALGYVGALVAGILLPITFTAPIATITLFYLGGHYDVGTVTLLGAVGALIGDLGIFIFVKDGTMAEIEGIRSEYRINHRTHGHYRRHRALVDLFKSKPFHALSLFIGGLLILSPFPDELGIAIFASYKVNIKKFIPLSLTLNTIGVWLVVMAGHLFVG